MVSQEGQKSPSPALKSEMHEKQQPMKAEAGVANFSSLRISRISASCILVSWNLRRTM
jgi:hypothetical protein